MAAVPDTCESSLHPPMQVKIGTRGSPLALAQAYLTRDILKASARSAPVPARAHARACKHTARVPRPRLVHRVCMHAQRCACTHVEQHMHCARAHMWRGSGVRSSFTPVLCLHWMPEAAQCGRACGCQRCQGCRERGLPFPRTCSLAPGSAPRHAKQTPHRAPPPPAGKLPRAARGGRGGDHHHQDHW